MKKFILWCSVFFFLFLPLGVKAAEISDTSIIGDTSKKIGEELSITFKIKVSDIDKSENNQLGVVAVALAFSFNEDDLTVLNVSSPDFNSEILKEDGMYIIASELLENASNQYCVNGMPNCKDYQVTVKFLVKETTNSTLSIIALENVAVGIYNLKEYNPNIENVLLITDSSLKRHNLKIIHPEKVNEKPVIKEETPLVDTKTNSSTTSEQSSNNLLSSIEIEQYHIEFDKNKTDYIIETDNDIDKLNIKVTTEDNKANYKIIGAEDLKTNQDKVEIIVTAENKETKTYTIQVKRKNEVKEEKTEENKKEKTFVNKKMIMLLGIIFGSILLIGIIILLISRRNNKKIDKLLDKL